jgi:methyltransferase (TIGR00027 family)
MAQLSLTSIWVAAARAYGARDPDARVRNPDYLAERLLGPAERALLGDHPIVAALDQPYEQTRDSMEVGGLARMLTPRTRFIDDRLQAAVANQHIEQLVILGAGFDTRAYRFVELLQDVRVFEVDHPDTQQVKIARVREAVGEPPLNLTYAPIDFRHQTLSDAMNQAGYRRDCKTFFIWEGVTMYLPEDAVRDTLRWIASSAASGSSVVFDYTYDSNIQRMKAVDMTKLPEAVRQAAARMTRMFAREPWLFGVPDNAEKEFLSSLGLELKKTLGLNSKEAVETYLTRSDGTVFGMFPASEQQGYLILEATVSAQTPQ